MDHILALQTTIALGERGRIVLPAQIRHHLGLVEGDKMVIVLDKDESIRLVSLRKQVKKLRGTFKNLKPKGRKLVDELIAERRQEAKREDAGS